MGWIPAPGGWGIGERERERRGGGGSWACSIMVVGSVSVQCDRLRQKSWSPRSVSVWQP